MLFKNRVIRTYLILAVLLFLPTMQVLAGESLSASATAVGSIGFTVSSMDRSVAFYSDVLTFRIISDVEGLYPYLDSCHTRSLDCSPFPTLTYREA